MALTDEQRATLGDVLEIHEDEVIEHVKDALAALRSLPNLWELNNTQTIAYAQAHALLALGLRVDSLVSIVSAAALPELAPDGIEPAPDLEEDQ